MAEDEVKESSEESQATAESQEPQPEATEAKGHNLDKGLQRFQSQLTKVKETTATKADLARLEEMISNLTPQQQVQASADLADDDIPQVSTLKGVEQRLSDQVAALTFKTDELTRSYEASKYWDEWDRKNPEIKGQGPSILEDAKEAIEEEYPNVPESEKDSIAYRSWISDRHKKLTTSRKGSLSKTSQSKPSTKPRESEDGAEIKPESAAAATTDGIPKDRLGLYDFGM